MVGRNVGRRPRPLAMGVCALVFVLVGGLALNRGLSRMLPPATSHAATSGRITALGPTDRSRTLTITLVLRGQATRELDQTLASVSDPSSPSFRHFLTPTEIARRFGASAQAQAVVATVLQAAGLAVVGRSADGTLISARGSVGRIETLFGVQVQDYRASDGRRFFAANTAPRIPVALRDAVLGVLGLENYRVAHPASLTRRAGGTAGLSPDDLLAAYDIAPLRRDGLDGSGQTIAFAEIDTFKQADVDAYDSAFSINAPPVEVVQVGEGASAADKQSETTLDIEVAHAIAPKAHLIAYEGGGDTASLAQIFSQIVTEHRAQVISISLGLCERFVLSPDQAPQDLQSAFTASGQSFFSSLDNAFREAGASGMSVLVASGDTGAYGCNQLEPSNHEVGASAPATSPYVTAVGGTALFTHDDGSYEREYGWEGPLEGAGGGGGLSLQSAQPAWQTGPGVANQYSNGMRQVPDVSADSDPLTGYAIFDSTTRCSGQDCWSVVGGTSAAAPLWAGLIALANQAADKQGLHSVGFLNPALYRMGSESGAPSPFHDITGGGNLYYPATSGWDFSTGWGSPDGSIFVQRLVALQRGA